MSPQDYSHWRTVRRPVDGAEQWLVTGEGGMRPPEPNAFPLDEGKRAQQRADDLNRAEAYSQFEVQA